MHPHLRRFSVLFFSSIGIFFNAWSYPVFTPPETRMGCSAMVESFCDRLWSPQALGNLDLGSQYAIRLGRAPNDLTQNGIASYKRTLAARHKLPADLRKPLERMGYFDLLQKSIHRLPNSKMTPEQLHADRRLSAQIEQTWSAALDETIFARIEPVSPKFYQLNPDQVSQSNWTKLTEISDKLDAQIHLALFAGSPEWKNIEQTFNAVKKDMLAEIADHSVFSQSVKDDWSNRIAGVRLEIPGSDAEQMDKEAKNCARTETNAYYSPIRNRITVCAGFMNGSEIASTLAHELAHALAPRRQIYLYKQKSTVAQKLQDLMAHSCKIREEWTCPEWEDFKKEYIQAAEQLAPIQIPHEEYFACHRKRTLKKTVPDSELVEYIAQGHINDTLEFAASRSWLLQMTQPTEILRTGATHPNPRYLNPCGFFWSQPQFESLSHWQILLSFFGQEYKCLSGKPAEKLEKAGQVAKELSLPLIKKEVLVPGPFSTNIELARRGYAEDIEEDFADSLSSDVFARMLSRKAELKQKRAMALSSIATLCDEPSIKKQFPDEAAAQKKFYFEPHSEGIERRQRLLTRRVREELQCDRDFKDTVVECH